MRKPTIWFPNRSNTNQAVLSQKQVRSLKFWIKEEEDMYYGCSKNIGVISFAVTVKLICAFGYACAKCWFSHEAALIIDVHHKGGNYGLVFCNLIIYDIIFSFNHNNRQKKQLRNCLTMVNTVLRTSNL